MARWGGGHAPFGYRPVALDDGGFDLVPDSATVPIVEYLAGQVIAGRSVNSLARELTERRILTPQGHRRWGTEVLLRMLASPVLRGYITTTKPGGEPEIVRGSDGMPVTREPVLGDTTWAALRAELEKTRQPRYGNRRDASLLLRIAFCGLCGAPLYQDRHKPRNKVYNYYSCRDRRDGCKLPGLPMNALEELVEEILLDELGEVSMRTKVHHPAQDSADQIRLAEESREALEEQFMAGQLSAESFARMTTRLEARQETLRQIPSRPATAEWVETGESFAEHWSQLDAAQRHQLLVKLGSVHMRGMILAASQKVGSRSRYGSCA